MYTLRRITSEGVQINFALGSSYVLVEREKNPIQFERDYNNLYGKEEIAIRLDDINHQVYALVSNENGSQVYELLKHNWNYIMSESGKTFSNLTFKN